LNCWICGKVATTKEHLFKASDIKLYFPDVSQEKPLYLHKIQKLNQPFASKKSDILKSNAMICQQCNGTTTQPHDFAWQELSLYLFQNKRIIFQTKKLNLKHIFPGTSTKNSINVQLFFLKLFGCLLEETSHRIITNEFASYILSNSPNPNVFLSFVKSHHHFIGLTTVLVHTESTSGRLARAHWCYCLGDLWIRVNYVHPNNYSLETPKGWNPSHKSKNIKLINMPHVRKNEN
jgi:hypothetical protein